MCVTKKKNPLFFWCCRCWCLDVYGFVCLFVYFLTLFSLSLFEFRSARTFFFVLHFVFGIPFWGTLSTTYCHIMMTQNEMKLEDGRKQTATEKRSEKKTHTQHCKNVWIQFSWNQVILVYSKFLKHNDEHPNVVEHLYLKQKKKCKRKRRRRRRTCEIKSNGSLCFNVTRARAAIKTMNKTKIHLEWYGDIYLFVCLMLDEQAPNLNLHTQWLLSFWVECDRDDSLDVSECLKMRARNRVYKLCCDVLGGWQ